MKLHESRLLLAMALLGTVLCCTTFVVAAPQDEAQDEAQPTAEELVNQAKGQAALAEAQDHMANRRWRLAIEAFRTALTYLPGNPEAMSGLQRAQAEWDAAPTLEGVADDLRVLLGRARAEFDASMLQAEQRLIERDFNGAERLVLTAQIRLRQARNLFSEREFSERNEQAEALLANIDSEREIARLADEQASQLAAERAQREQQLQAEQERRHIIAENLRRVRQLQAELKYDEALQVIDEILFIDELNPAGLALRDIIQTSMLYREYQEVQRQREMGFPWHSLENQRATIAPRPNRTGPGDRSVISDEPAGQLRGDQHQDAGGLPGRLLRGRRRVPLPGDR
jgi:hypothetical protein